jgi:hypothetical protein
MINNGSENREDDKDFQIKGKERLDAAFKSKRVGYYSTLTKHDLPP